VLHLPRGVKHVLAPPLAAESSHMSVHWNV